MDTCAVETGLLSKKPCGHPAATHCANCEMALCSKHAVPQLANGKKTGKYMCKECDAARKQFEKSQAAAAESGKKPAASPPAGAPAAKAAAAAKPGQAPSAAPPAAKAKEEPKKKDDDDAPLEFTPSKPPAGNKK